MSSKHFYITLENFNFHMRSFDAQKVVKNKVARYWTVLLPKCSPYPTTTIRCGVIFQYS